MPREVQNQLSAVKVRQIRAAGPLCGRRRPLSECLGIGARWWVWRGIIKGGKRRELGLTAAPTPEDFKAATNCQRRGNRDPAGRGAGNREALSSARPAGPRSGGGARQGQGEVPDLLTGG